MAQSIKFWALSTQIAELDGQGGLRETEFGHSLFSSEGLDPYIEDIKTLWLLHWKLSTHRDAPLLAWDFLLNKWHEPEISRSSVLNVLENEKITTNPSTNTLKDHLDIFIRTYVPTRGVKGKIKEDNLDCPLVELELIQKIGDKVYSSEEGKPEPVYIFNRDDKPEITPELFAFCVYEFILNEHSNESTVSFHELSVGHRSPGQVFKLSESNLRSRLEDIEKDTNGQFVYTESSNLQQLQVVTQSNKSELLKKIYQLEVV